jgi:hypothetical protein
MTNNVRLIYSYGFIRIFMCTDAHRHPFTIITYFVLLEVRYCTAIWRRLRNISFFSNLYDKQRN